MPTFYNPENAMKRANEFCELGKDDEALECLYDTLKNRKIRMIKHIHEMIIYKLLELSVQHRKSQMAKDGLYCYRNLCQGINIKSWEDSLSYYIKLSESKVESAEESYHSVNLDVDDLNQSITPEILLKSVSNQGSQDRAERSILLPWIKFLWECYRNCLDLLKNTTQSNRLYHAVAKSAFIFCVKFSRKSELRKLCNVIKIHAIYMQNKETWSKNDDADGQFICLDTGFVELDSAIKMELWQDAFKAVENINALITVTKLTHNSMIMAHYYNKISIVFWKGGEYLFHAAANLRYFLILKDQKKKLTTVDIVKLASRLMLSILAIPLSPVNPTTDLIIETDVKVIARKERLFTSLLFLTKCPTRASLIKEAMQFNIVQYLPEALAILFQTLENNSDIFFPSISTKIDFIKVWCEGEFEEYTPLLQKVLVAKLLPSLSKLYANIKITKLFAFTGISKMSVLEMILIESARRYGFPLRIDHRNMCVHFSDDFNVFRNENALSESLTENLQSSTCLIWIKQIQFALKNAVKQIQPQSEENENKLLAQKISNQYSNEKEFYRKSILKRRNIIEKYKESLEKSRLKKEEEERRRVTEKLLQYEAAEKERLHRETEERKLQRIQREQAEIKRKLFLEKIETLKKSVLGCQIVENLELEKIECLDPQILFNRQVEQLNKERKQLNLRLRRQERNVDHFERAKRIEEIPLLTEQYEKENETDEKLWTEAVKNKIDAVYKKREEDLRKKNRVLEIKPDLEKSFKLLKKRYSEIYKEEMMQYEKTLNEEKQKRLQKRAEDRKQKRKNDWIKQKSIEEKKKSEHNNKDTWMKECDFEKSLPVKSVMHQNGKSAESPKASANIPSVDEMLFGEDISSCKEKVLSREFRKKYNSTETSERVHISNSIYYSKTMHKSNTVETERIEVCDRRSSIFTEASSELLRKSSYQTQNQCNANQQKMRPHTYEKSCNETLLSWRTPWAQKDSYPNRNNNEREISRRDITILRRESRLETTSDKKILDVQKEKVPKSESIRNDIKYSCTPWAKLKRKTFEK